MNAFEQLADRAIPRAVKAREARRESRGSERIEEARAERAALSRSYHAARQRWIEETLARPGGENLRAMLRWVDTIGIDDAEILVVQVERATWLRTAEIDFRRLALDVIADRIIKIREKAGLAPFEDPLPGEPDDVFRTVKRLLSVQ